MLIEKLFTEQEFLESLKINCVPNNINMYYDILYNVSVVLHDYRQQHNLSKAEMAKILNVSQWMIDNYESGDYNFTLMELCNVMNKIGVDISLKINSKLSKK